MEDKKLDVNTDVDKENQDVAGERCFVRLNKSERNQHLIFAGCFMVLAVTGFMSKVPEEIVQVLGKYRETVFLFRSFLHRVAGVTMMLTCLYHLYYLIFKSAGRRWLIDMLPRFKDVKDIMFNLLYYVNAREEPPEFDRFCYKHKLEYGALIAGTTLMTVSGLLLWMEFMWSKFILDIAAVVHGMEAVLACLAIAVWHIYEVQLKPGTSPLNNKWYTGLISEEEMKEEHLGHYKKVMSNPKLQKIYIQE